MKHLLAMLAAWSVLAMGIAQAVPARPLYVPEEPPKPPPPRIMDLNGTAWLGKYLARNRTYIFEPDGTLSYRITKTTVRNRGSWRLEGKTLYFEMGTKAAKLLEFRGTLQEDGTINGESQTRTGQRTLMTLQPVKLDK